MSYKLFIIDKIIFDNEVLYIFYKLGDMYLPYFINKTKFHTQFNALINMSTSIYLQ
jgi:hypothetical protein